MYSSGYVRRDNAGDVSIVFINDTDFTKQTRIHNRKDMTPDLLATIFILWLWRI